MIPTFASIPIVSFELATLLKEKDFNEPCILQYYCSGDVLFCLDLWGNPKFKTNDESYSDSGGECISAPTLMGVINWLCKTHGVWVKVDSETDGEYWFPKISICSDESWKNDVIRNKVYHTNNLARTQWFSSPEIAYEFVIKTYLEYI